MTTEDRLRHALRTRADAVVPTQPEWSRVADRFGRRRRRRPSAAVMPILAALAVLIMAVVVWVDPGSDGSRPLRTAGPPSTAGAPATDVVHPPTVPVPPPDLPYPRGGSVPPGFQPISTTWISTSQGWVLGDAPCSAPPCPSLLRTTDGGVTWTGGPAPRTGSGRSTIRFADARNGWTYGEELWATHNAGSTWSRVEGLPGRVSRLESSEERAWAVVETNGDAFVFTTAVGTDDWRRVAPDPVQLNGSLVLQGTGGYVVGPDGSVLALTPGALDRRGAPCGIGLVSLAPAGSALFALCVNAAGPALSTKTLLVSSDGARTWSNAGNLQVGLPFGLVAASRSTIIVAAGGGGASLLHRSDDGGATWTSVYDDATVGGAAFYDLGFTSPSRGSVILDSPPAEGVLLQTSDGGRTWMPLDFGP